MLTAWQCQDRNTGQSAERREGTGREKNHRASWGHQREACNEPWSSTSQYTAEAPSQIGQLINFVSNLGQIGFSPFPLYKQGTFAASFSSLHVNINFSVWYLYMIRQAQGLAGVQTARRCIQLVMVTETLLLSNWVSKSIQASLCVVQPH